MEFYEDDFNPQSGVPASYEGENFQNLTSQNVSIQDGNPGHIMGVPSDMSVPVGGDSSTMPLNEFMARPVKLGEFEWTQIPGALNYEIRPWAHFVDARIINRIAHYKRLRGTLKMRIVITGNGFYYGRIMCSYLPRPENDDMTRYRNLINEDLVEASQRQHIFLDPTTSSGGEFEFPFLNPYETIDIVPSTSFNNMGILHFFEVNPLQHANSVTDPVTISIFTWCDNLEISGSTCALSTLMVPQAGKNTKNAKKNEKNDEYGTGIVSKPASIVAGIAGKLTDVPFIAPYARATQIGAGALSNIASLFGYCKPVNIDVLQNYRPAFVSNVCNADGQDNCTKLSLESKQETTIDTRVMGLDGEDEMMIAGIAKRQSYLVTFPWSTTDNSTDRLFHAKVTPAHIRTLIVQEGIVERHLTACCYATAPFTYWRGTIRFRFQIVASAYHRGRLRIYYDPHRLVTGIPYNVGYSTIVDLGETRDFTVDIGWTSPRGMLEMGRILDGQKYQIGSGNTNYDPLKENGVVAVEVMQPLTLPAGVPSEIGVNVFVSTGDDIEVAAPDTDNFNGLSVFQPQSGKPAMTTDMEGQATENEPEQAESESINVMAIKPTNAEVMHSIYSGEVIKSWRTLAKRSCLNYYANIDPDFPCVLDTYPTYPLFPGKDPNGAETITGAPGSATMSNWTFLNWIMMGYVGYRGSIRVRACMLDPTNQSSFLSITRTTPRTNRNHRNREEYALGTYNDYRQKWIFNRLTRDNSNGTVFSSTEQQPCVEAEIPYYQNRKFLYGKKLSQSSLATDSEEYTGFEVAVYSDTDAPQILGYWLAYSAGEDFQVGMYQGPPVLFDYFPEPPPL